MFLITWSSVTAEKVENIGRGISMEMCCVVKDAGKVEWIF